MYNETLIITYRENYVDKQWVHILLMFYCALCTCVDDVDKLRFQGGPAHQEAVHVGLRRQLPAVRPRDRTWTQQMSNTWEN